jgi:hypothetical protein
MALTIPIAADKAWRLIPLDRRPDAGDVESWIAEAMKSASEKSATNPVWLADFSDILALTLSAADAEGLQSVAIPTTHFPKSVIVLDEVAHSDLLAVGPLIQRGSISLLKPPHVLSTSVYGYYTVSDNKIYARRATSALATTASALRARATKCIVSISDWPLQAEHYLIAEMLILAGIAPPPQLLERAA